MLEHFFTTLQLWLRKQHLPPKIPHFLPCPTLNDVNEHSPPTTSIPPCCCIKVSGAFPPHPCRSSATPYFSSQVSPACFTVAGIDFAAVEHESHCMLQRFSPPPPPPPPFPPRLVHAQVKYGQICCHVNSWD